MRTAGQRNFFNGRSSRILSAGRLRQWRLLNRLLLGLLVLLPATSYGFNLDTITPGPIRSGQLVTVTGTGFAQTRLSLIGDQGSKPIKIARTPTELFFTIPFGTAAGPYELRFSQIENGETVVRPRQINISNAQIPRQPRIDRISIYRIRTNNTGRRFAVLYVQVANAAGHGVVKFKRGAEWIRTQATRPSRSLNNSAVFGALERTNFKYPIEHWIGFVAVLNTRQYNELQGKRVEFRFSNSPATELAATTSGKRVFRIPAANEAIPAMDFDGDGIPNADDDSVNSPDVHLALGYLPDQLYLFPPIQAAKNKLKSNLEAALALAPIINPDGNHGLQLHMEQLTIPWVPPASKYRGLSLDSSRSPGGVTKYKRLKELGLRQSDNAEFLGRFGHFGIWARSILPHKASGYSDANLLCESETPVGGDDFLISIDDQKFLDNGWAELTSVTNMMHELGHNLGLCHSGQKGFPYNPTYNSIMSYSWLNRDIGDPSSIAYKRQYRPVYAPIRRRTRAGISVFSVDFSDGMGVDLSEASITPLYQTTDGLSSPNWAEMNQTRYCDCDASTQSCPSQPPGKFDIDCDQVHNTTMADHPDWQKIRLNRGNGGKI